MAQAHPIVHPIPSIKASLDHNIGYVTGLSLLTLTSGWALRNRWVSHSEIHQHARSGCDGVVWELEYGHSGYRPDDQTLDTMRVAQRVSDYPNFCL